MKTSLNLTKVNCFYLHPSLIRSLFKSVLSCHSQTYITVFIGQFLFPCIKYFSYQSKRIMTICIFSLDSLCLYVFNSLFERIEKSFFEIETIKWKILFALSLFLFFDDSGKMSKKFRKIIKFDLFFDFLIKPSNFKASEYFLFLLVLFLTLIWFCLL